MIQPPDNGLKGFFADSDLSFQGASVFVLLDKAYIAYGNLNSISTYDPVTNEIQDLGDVFDIDDGEVGDARGDAFAFNVDDKGFFGFGQSGFSSPVFHSDIYIFEIPNEYPSGIGISSLSISENEPANTVVGELSTFDLDVNDVHTFELTAGNGLNDEDNSAFGINGNELIALSALDFESKADYFIHIKVSDQSGGFFEQAFVIEVQNVNEAPEVGNHEFSVNENASASTEVGQIVASDPENDDLSYSFISGNDNGVFGISSDGLLTVTNGALLDHETANIARD